ncbi:MAG TPA: ATP-dependent helicase HrpB [Acidimicrobiales bacterium]|nr:ATP-dependent helicase HrpB [Acidimicrobiales bacterium]
MPAPPPLTDLPVEDVVTDVRAALADPGLAVLEAPPGAGKTTIIPLRLLDEPWLAGQRTVVLEPRRVAARAAARRMSTLVGDEPGGLVGWRTRIDRSVSDRTRVEVVTEGIVTRRLQHDPALAGVGLLVFDEFHERNLQADLGLALALEARATVRPDLRILVMSATLDGGRVATLLGGSGPAAPVIVSEGRTHPVEIRWLPRHRNDRLEDAMAAAIGTAVRERTDGVLAFLPGAGEIRRVADRLSGSELPPGIEVHPLYGALPAVEQDAALAPPSPGIRKVVLATDLAESSLTVEGIGVVIDSGLARAPRFDPRSGMTRLTTISISRASADQRAGRAGRTGPGIAWRLWSKVEHAARRPHRDPEIAQVDLAGLALELAAWGTPVEQLGFLDPPPARALTEARNLLRELDALDPDGKVTAAGKAMADLPLHPRLAHMVQAAAPDDRWLACVLASLLDDRDVLRGRVDELPADLELRVALLDDPSRSHPALDGRSVRAARDRAHDVARRLGVIPHPLHDPLGRTGRVLALAYPDRVAQRRGSPGRFRLRSGPGAWVPPTDPLAAHELVVAADLDGKRRDARIRLGAALDPGDLDGLFGDQIETREVLTWDRDRDDLVVRTDRRLGSLQLAATERKPTPGPTTVEALVGRVRATRLAALHWTDDARSVQQRVAFLRRTFDTDWPDLDDRELLRRLDDWLAPFLQHATGRRDLDVLDIGLALRTLLPFDQQLQLDDLAPTRLTLPNGRTATIDYAGERPMASARVQAFFGSGDQPTVAGGRVPVVLQLLSPADRPIQTTSDLAGFWSGSWAEVRKDMAGRYPKHDWPEHPGP